MKYDIAFIGRTARGADLTCDCHGRGWNFFIRDDAGAYPEFLGKLTVQKCDECGVYPDDKTAAAEAVKYGVPVRLTYPCIVEDHEESERLPPGAVHPAGPAPAVPREEDQAGLGQADVQLGAAGDPGQRSVSDPPGAGRSPVQCKRRGDVRRGLEGVAAIVANGLQSEEGRVLTHWLCPLFTNYSDYILIEMSSENVDIILARMNIARRTIETSHSFEGMLFSDTMPWPLRFDALKALGIPVSKENFFLSLTVDQMASLKPESYMHCTMIAKPMWVSWELTMQSFSTPVRSKEMHRSYAEHPNVRHRSPV